MNNSQANKNSLRPTIVAVVSGWLVTAPVAFFALIPAAGFIESVNMFVLTAFHTALFFFAVWVLFLVPLHRLVPVHSWVWHPLFFFPFGMFVIGSYCATVFVFVFGANFSAVLQLPCAAIAVPAGIVTSAAYLYMREDVYERRTAKKRREFQPYEY